MVTQEPGEPQTRAAQPGARMLGPTEKALAVILIVAFLAFVVTLVVLRRDTAWDRLMYLFTGLEALVFAAAGALFGTVVQRTQTNQAREQASRERVRADANEQAARRGRAMAALVRAKRQRTAPDAGEGRGARPMPGASRVEANPDMAELAAVVDEWFPADPPSPQG